jgi:hypothetical protein
MLDKKEMKAIDNGLELSFDELKTVYEIDNYNGDCDCSLCRTYRQIVKERKISLERR